MFLAFSIDVIIILIKKDDYENRKKKSIYYPKPHGKDTKELSCN